MRLPLRLRAFVRLVLIPGLLLIGAGAQAEQRHAGRVEFAIGAATATGADQKARPLSKGALVFEGDLINTASGRVQVRFTDGAFVSLQPQTQFKVEKYHYAGKQDGAEKGIFNLVKGGMRTITGLIGKTDNKNYRVHTKVATIGVRGTEYSLNMEVALTGSVAAGQIDVCNGGGCAPFARGESFIVPHASARPVITLRKADLPAPSEGEGKPSAQPESADGDTKPPGPPANAAGGPLPDSVGLVQGNTTDSSGTAVPFNLKGTHFLMIATAAWTGSGLFGITAPAMGTIVLDDNGVAQSVANKVLFSANGGSNGFAAGGFGTDTSTGKPLHYMAGYPTLPGDMQWLKTSMPIGNYSLFASTDITGFTGANGPSTEAVIGKIQGGALSANFATGAVGVQMNLQIAGKVTGLSGVNVTMPTSAPTFGGGCNAGSQCRIDGFFIGPKAQNAGLVYEFGGAVVNGQIYTGRGMAAFQKNP